MNLIKRAISFVLISVIILSLATPVFAADNIRATTKRVVKVAYPEQKYLTEIEGSENYNGYSYEYLKKIAEFANWKLEYITYGDMSLNNQILAGMEDVESGKADLIGVMLKTEDLEKKFLYSDKNYGAVYTTLDALDTNLSINETNYMKKDKLRIAILKTAKVRNSELQTFLNNAKINYEYVYCDSIDEQIQALKNDSADVMLKVSLTFLPDLKQIVQFSPRPYYFISNLKNDEIIEELDSAISKINKTDPYFESRLQSKYFKNTMVDFNLTDSEKTYVEKNRELQVLVLPKYAPFAFLDENGTLSGISVSILDEIGKKSGIKFNYHVLQGNENLDELMTSGNYSVVLGPPHSGSFAENYGLVLSQPYMESGLTMFTNKQSEDKPKSECVLALLNDVANPIEYDYKEIKYYDDIEQCLAAVNNGEADYGYVSQYVIDMYTTENSHKNLKYLNLSGYSRQIGFYVPYNTDYEVLTIINKYIRSLPDKDIHSFLAIALSKKDNGGIERFIQDNPMLIMAIATVFLLLCLLIILLAIYNRTNKKRNEKLEQAYSSKSDFLSSMSHDMRTPMNGIIGLTGLTLDIPELPVEVKDNLEKIDESAKYLLSLINDTLDMNKIESDKIKLSLEPTEINTFLNQMLSAIQVNADQKKVELISHCNDVKLPRVNLDRLRVQQILFNIISNAIKFTPEYGMVKVDCFNTVTSQSSVHTVVSIEDTGIGISKEFLPKIFEPFEQESRASNSNYAGTGLGLAIVKNLVDMMGGKIEVESEKGKGTKFVVELDFKVAEKQTAKETVKIKTEENLSGKRILLCEDHPLNAQIAQKLLQKKDMLIELAENGQIAVDMFKGSKLNYFDAILMDIRMPVIDGLTAAKMIREIDREDAKTIPIIAMTANAFDEDVEKSKKAGMNFHLAKPIDPQKLYQTLNDLIC